MKRKSSCTVYRMLFAASAQAAQDFAWSMTSTSRPRRTLWLPRAACDPLKIAMRRYRGNR